MIKARVEIDNTKRSLKDFTGTKEQEKSKVEELNRKYGETSGITRPLPNGTTFFKKKGKTTFKCYSFRPKPKAW